MAMRNLSCISQIRISVPILDTCSAIISDASRMLCNRRFTKLCVYNSKKIINVIVKENNMQSKTHHQRQHQSADVVDSMFTHFNALCQQPQQQQSQNMAT
eukprot:GEZU01033070.1.p3 GENE.GEZU01033070.1~~GEZU01033070.1.p3  ORF type:complete len:100 (+),score=7.45 GEZU01033070.1:330-629(+)